MGRLLAVAYLTTTCIFISGCGSTDIYRCYGDVTDENGIEKPVFLHEPIVMTVVEGRAWWMQPVAEWFQGQQVSEGFVTIEAPKLDILMDFYGGLETADMNGGRGWVRRISDTQGGRRRGAFTALSSWTPPWERSDRSLHLILSTSAGNFDGLCALFESK